MQNEYSARKISGGSSIFQLVLTFLRPPTNFGIFCGDPSQNRSKIENCIFSVKTRRNIEQAPLIFHAEYSFCSPLLSYLLIQLTKPRKWQFTFLKNTSWRYAVCNRVRPQKSAAAISEYLATNFCIITF